MRAPSPFLDLPLTPLISVDNPPPKVVQGYKVCIDYPTTDFQLTSYFSSTSFTRIWSTNQKLLRTKSSGNPGMRTPCCCISALGPHMKTSVSGSSIGSGSFHINGEQPCVLALLRQFWTCWYRGFRSSFDRGCLSLWFNFRRNVGPSTISSCIQCSLTATVLSKVDDLKHVLAYVSSLQFPQCNVVYLCFSANFEFTTDQLVLGGQVSKKTNTPLWTWVAHITTNICSRASCKRVSWQQSIFGNDQVE